MRKFLTSFWGMFAVLFALVLMGANTPFLVGNAQYPINWFNSVRLVLPWRQATELPNQRVRIETGSTNWLRNPGFEAATISPWTTSGSPTTSFPTASYEGAQALSISQTSGSGKYVQGCVTTTDQVGGTNLEMSAFVMGSTASGYQVCSVVDGVEKQCVTAPDNGNQYTQVTATAIAPTTVLADDNVCIRIKSISSGSVGIYVDEAYLGPNRNIGTVAQATYVGRLHWTVTANCQWSLSSGSWQNYSADPDCPNPTATGGVSAAGTKIPAVVLPAEAGFYEVTFIGEFRKIGSTDAAAGFRLSDGTNSRSQGAAYAGGATTENGGFNLVGIFESTGSPLTIQVQGIGSAGRTADVLVTNIDFEVIVKRYPSKSEQVLRMNCSGAACGTNDFSAYVDGSANVSKENVEWISSCTGTTTKTCTFSSTFSQIPNCLATGNSNPEARVTSISTSQVVVEVSNSGGTLQSAGSFFLYCGRVGSDRVATNMPLIKGGVTSDSATVGVIGAGSFYTTAWGTVCSAASCTMTADTTTGWTIVRSTTGQYKVLSPKAYASGFSCTVHVATTGTAFATSVPQTGNSTTEYFFVTKNAAGTNVDTYGSFTCFGGRP